MGLLTLFDEIRGFGPVKEEADANDDGDGRRAVGRAYEKPAEKPRISDAA